MELIKKTDSGLVETAVIKFDPEDEEHHKKMIAVFEEAGIIYLDTKEFISLFEKKGIHFVVEIPSFQLAYPSEADILGQDQIDIDHAVSDGRRPPPKPSNTPSPETTG